MNDQDLSANDPANNPGSDEDSKNSIIVEVACATPEKQLIVPLKVPLGTSASEAVRLSKLCEEFPGIDIEKDPMGIFSKPLDGKGRPKPQEYQLCAGDRVEIYRPLIIDPKRARLDRANIAKPAARKPKARKPKADKTKTKTKTKSPANKPA